MRHNRLDIKWVTLHALLLSVALVLGLLESLIPAAPGVPGIKLGLSNIVLLFSLYTYGPGSAALLMVLKALLSGLLFAGPSGMMYSFAGGALSVAGMILVRKIPGVSILGVSILGAVLHNVGQVALAMLILKTDQLLYYMAVLMLVGIGTGLLTGVSARLALKHLAGRTPWGGGPGETHRRC